MKRFSILAAVAAFIVVFVGFAATGRDTRYEVSLRMRTTAGSLGQLFYAGEGKGYSPDRSVAFAAISDGTWHEYRIRLGVHEPVARLRIDPGVESGEVAIGPVAIRTPGADPAPLAGRTLSAAVKGTNDVTSPRVEGEAIVFAASAGDPFIDLALPKGGSPWPARLGLAAVAAAVTFVLCLLFARLQRLPAYVTGMRIARHAAGRLAERLSEPSVVTVKAEAAAVLVALAVASVVYIALALHQSSVGVWESMYPAKPVHQLVDLGEPRRVRSDEWNTQTPWILNQVQRGAGLTNSNIGGERAPLLASVPVLGSVATFQPKFLGFVLFDLEHGYSWWWAYKTFGLVAAFFWLLLILTRGNTAMSLLGAVWVYASSFSQWWLSSNLAEILIAFALGVIGAYYLLYARRRRWLFTGALLAVYSIISLLLHLYPPFILPMAYLGVFLLAASLVEPGATDKIRDAWGIRLMTGMVVVATSALLLASYVGQAEDTIATMMATIYPGHRVAVPGSVTLERALYAWFEAFRFGELRFPAAAINASEASSFVLAFPIGIAALRVRGLLRREGAYPAALALYALLVLFWMCCSMPEPLAKLYQSAGWSWSPPERSLVGLGIGSILLAIIVAAHAEAASAQAGILRPLEDRRWIPLLAVIVVGMFGWGLRKSDESFITPGTIAAGMLLAFLLSRGISQGKRASLALGVALLAIPGATVNPLTSGLSAILDKPILSAARAASDGPADRWAVVGDFVFAQGLKARGLDVVNGSQMVPDARLHAILDPARRHTDVWNRYAHVLFESAPGSASPEYSLGQADLYVVKLDICGPQMRAMRVNRIAYTRAVPDQDLRCLEPIAGDDSSGVRLFKLVPPKA